MPLPNPPALKARNQLLALFVALCILDAVLVFLAQDKWAIARILITVGVMYFVAQGRKWAKWVLVGICSLRVVSLTAMIVVLSSKLSIGLIAGSLVMILLSAIIPIYMIRSQDLNRYFAHKRQSSSQ